MRGQDRRTSPYHSIRAEDHDDSSTDVEETIDLNEKDGDYMQDPSSSPWSKRRQMLAAFKEHRWLIDTFLLLVIVALLLEKSWASRGQNHFFEGAGDITGFAPQFPQQVKTFAPDPVYMPENTSEFYSVETREKWLSLVPKGLGYLEIKEPQNYDNLPKQLESFKKKDKFVVTSSMTHQLHCLHSIAEAYAALTQTPAKVPRTNGWNLSHCFDYLRQSIMCCGDVALEGQQTTFPAGFDGSDGWDAKHVCKNYEQVFQYLEDKAVNGKVWI
ncbi:hypothetical protein F5X96DRAFT_642251 [Biscogniauxia mediterranea]|nr:hypothetical protein F5X96DRAFT_642251 [Biscogniauxia mediterranea]